MMSSNTIRSPYDFRGRFVGFVIPAFPVGDKHTTGALVLVDIDFDTSTPIAASANGEPQCTVTGLWRLKHIGWGRFLASARITEPQLDDTTGFKS